MYYTYVLKSEKDNKFYVGFTKDIKLRFEKHSKGQVESTRDRRPLNLIYYEGCLSQADATKREKYVKTYPGKMFIKKRLKSYLTGYDTEATLRGYSWKKLGCKDPYNG